MCEFYCNLGIKTKVVSLGIKDKFVSHGSIEKQLCDNGLTADNIIKVIGEKLLVD